MKSTNPQRYKNGDTVKAPKIWIIKMKLQREHIEKVLSGA